MRRACGRRLRRRRPFAGRSLYRAPTRRLHRPSQRRLSPTMKRAALRVDHLLLAVRRTLSYLRSAARHTWLRLPMMKRSRSHSRLAAVPPTLRGCASDTCAHFPVATCPAIRAERGHRVCRHLDRRHSNRMARSSVGPCHKRGYALTAHDCVGVASVPCTPPGPCESSKSRCTCAARSGVGRWRCVSGSRWCCLLLLVTFVF